MFDKILIANRGEIACRIIRTCKRLGIRTVAVYSEADRTALHTELADEAVFIGAAPASESYLVAKKILAAAKQTGAQAIHPGFGFLSEQSHFIEAAREQGLVFIGPAPQAVALMGDKIESKKLAVKAGVSVVPGHGEAIDDPAQALSIARDIGYPVILKASAGGGGKGMRLAADDSQIKDALRLAQSEARSSFGDARVFIEKYITKPRHIEIQILCDQQGNGVYLLERECSLQRRHQKVIEEAPSPFISDITRRAMGEQALQLAKAVGYVSAGTVEFIVDDDQAFYFLEMNTRLQVEHPVTEMITGLDLVEWMIRIAAGEPLSFTQADVKARGWAVESRIYAEDPARAFLPSVGRLKTYKEPHPHAHLRVDSGVREGDEISLYYDPMIAKLITHGKTRGAAIARMQEGLDRFAIRGIAHNIGFLNAIMHHPDFQAGDFSTDFIGDFFPQGFASEAPKEAQDLDRFVAAAAVIAFVKEARLKTENGEQSFVLHSTQGQRRVTVRNQGSIYDIEDGHRRIRLETHWKYGQILFSALCDELEFAFQVDIQEPEFHLQRSGQALSFMAIHERVAPLMDFMPEKTTMDTSHLLLAPMPGLLVSLSVEEGQEVKAGEELAVVEAMKMENILRATWDAKVARVLVTPGSQLAVDQVILEFE